VHKFAGISLVKLTFETLISTLERWKYSSHPNRKPNSPLLPAHEVFCRALAEEARFVEAVKQGLASLDRGEYVSHKEVGARIDRLFQS
jgi:hypothetical protein